MEINMQMIAIIILSVQFVGITAYTAVVPEIWEAFYGDVVNFTCNTSLSEVFWTEDGRSVRGNSTSVDGWTVSVYQATVTKNATVSCFAEPAEDEFDTAQIILLEGSPTMRTTVTTVAMDADVSAPLQVNLQSGFGSLQDGTNISLSLTVTNISLPDHVNLPDNMRLPTHFLVDLLTSAGENATIFSPTYQPENLNTTMNITVFWTPDDSVDICNLYLTVTVSAVNSAGSSIPSNLIEITVTGCETTETPPSSGCGPGCIVGIILAGCVVVFCSVVLCLLYVFWRCSQARILDAHCTLDAVETSKVSPAVPENNGVYEHKGHINSSSEN